MNARRSFVLASLLSIAGCAANADTTNTESTGTTTQAYELVLAPATQPANMPVNGTFDPELAEVDAAVQKFMRATCTGAGAMAVSYKGKTILSRGYGYKKGAPTEACRAALGEVVASSPVSANTPFRLGSNSKAITAAIVREALKTKLYYMGRPTTDAELESLKIFDADLDLVSPRLRTFVNQNLGGGQSCATFPAETSPRTTNGRVDPRMLDITVGQLLGHRAGLPRGGNPITSKLSRLRNLNSSSAMANHESQIGAPASARGALKNTAGPNAYFLGLNTLEEYLMGNADLCLPYAPGGPLPNGNYNSYSNLGFGFLQHIAEHITGRPLAAELGDDSTHADSLVAELLDVRLGVTEGKLSQHGIYFSQPIPALRDQAEPTYRAWDGSSQLGRFADNKRPWCVFSSQAGTCNGLQFNSGFERYNWSWNEQLVGVSYENEGFSVGPGLFAAEMPIYLKLMSRYWISGGGSTPFYGRDRASNPSNASRWHIGELQGTHSTVAQFSGDVIEYFKVPRLPNGELDMTKWTNGTPRVESACRMPAGLDFAVSVNQVSDESCGQGICSDRYMALRDVIKEAFCGVTWSRVNTNDGVITLGGGDGNTRLGALGQR